VIDCTFCIIQLECRGLAVSSYVSAKYKHEPARNSILTTFTPEDKLLCRQYAISAGRQVFVGCACYRKITGTAQRLLASGLLGGYASLVLGESFDGMNGLLLTLGVFRINDSGVGVASGLNVENYNIKRKTRGGCQMNDVRGTIEERTLC
jgi:hypothetical protein